MFIQNECVCLYSLTRMIDWDILVGFE